MSLIVWRVCINPSWLIENARHALRRNQPARRIFGASSLAVGMRQYATHRAVCNDYDERRDHSAGNRNRHGY